MKYHKITFSSGFGDYVPDVIWELWPYDDKPDEHWIERAIREVVGDNDIIGVQSQIFDSPPQEIAEEKVNFHLKQAEYWGKDVSIDYQPPEDKIRFEVDRLFQEWKFRFEADVINSLIKEFEGVKSDLELPIVKSNLELPIVKRFLETVVLKRLYDIKQIYGTLTAEEYKMITYSFTEREIELLCAALYIFEGECIKEDLFPDLENELNGVPGEQEVENLINKLIQERAKN